MSQPRTFTFPAAYARAVEAALAIVLADIAHDAACRADEDPRVQRLARFEDTLVDPAATGTLSVTISAADVSPAMALDTDAAA